MVVAVVRLDGDVNQFLMLCQERAVGVATFGSVGHDRDDGRKFPATHLPNVQIGHYGIAITLDSLPNHRREIGILRDDIKKYRAGISQKGVSPRKDDAAADDSHHWIEPAPAERIYRM